ncbi:hypothetical protein Tcan_04624 [Toxocara canis]|uniref:Uncharacterized protein n=1 Tax=Toxocara canis TaxID=6265 RepID=A0A0B2VNC9_TOXCA|nr:hypothetical protein Tcan_04624 [Toxocara canis]
MARGSRYRYAKCVLLEIAVDVLYDLRHAKSRLVIYDTCCDYSNGMKMKLNYPPLFAEQIYDDKYFKYQCPAEDGIYSYSAITAHNLCNATQWPQLNGKCPGMTDTVVSSYVATGEPVAFNPVNGDFQERRFEMLHTSIKH